MATYKECAEMAQNIRERITDLEKLAQFIEDHGVELPSLPWIDRRESFSVWLTETKSYRDDNGEWQTAINEEATKENVRKFLSAVGNSEKEYTNHSVTIRKSFGNVTLVGLLDREVVCKKIVKSREYVKHSSDGYWKEDVEWDCATPSLVNFVNS